MYCKPGSKGKRSSTGRIRKTIWSPPAVTARVMTNPSTSIALTTIWEGRDNEKEICRALYYSIGLDRASIFRNRGPGCCKRRNGLDNGWSKYFERGGFGR